MRDNEPLTKLYTDERHCQVKTPDKGSKNLRNMWEK